MSSADYALYEKSTINLARTVTIGHKMIAETINAQLIKDNYAVSDDLTQWKYYMNLAGEYHQADHDYIASINADDNPYIQIQLGGLSGLYYVNLTKELLHAPSADPTIAVEYRFGTRGYDALIERYPQAIDLINGILYPVDKSVAMSVEPGSILQLGGYVRENDTQYPDRFHFKKSSLHTASGFNMLDDREISIIFELETWIKQILSRWLVNDYVFFNDYYLITIMAIIQSFLPAKIMLLRIQKAGTFEVNSYHVRERLDSIGYIGKYTEDLPEEVSMYLYRNYDLLDKARGRADMLEDLIRNVLDVIGIPADAYKTRLENTTFNYLLPYPKVASERLSASGRGNATKYLGLEVALERQQGVAEDNVRDYPSDIETSYAVLPREGNPDQLTKVIDSEWLIYGQDTPISLEDFLIPHWLYYSSDSRIGGFVFIEDPINGETIPLNNEAALYLAFYCYCRGVHDVTPKAIPSFTAQMVAKNSSETPEGYRPLPSTLELYQRHPEAFDYAFIEQFKGNYEPSSNYATARAFYEGILIQHNELCRRYRSWSTQYTAEHRAYLKRMNAELYWINLKNQPSRYGDDYSEFILGLGINLTDLDQTTYRNLFFEIVRKATGNIQTTDDQYRRIHNAAMNVMKHFMSYPVQFTHRTIVGDVEVRNIPVVRMIVEDMYAEYTYLHNLPKVQIDTAIQSSAAVPVRTKLAGVRHLAKVTATDIHGNPVADDTVIVNNKRKPTRHYTSRGHSGISITRQGVGHVVVTED